MTDSKKYKVSDNKELAKLLLDDPIVIGGIVQVSPELWEVIADRIAKSVYLPVELGDTIYVFSYRTDGTLYINPIKYVSVEIFRDMMILKDTDGVGYHLGVDAFLSYEEAQEVLQEKETVHE